MASSELRLSRFVACVPFKCAVLLTKAKSERKSVSSIDMCDNVGNLEMGELAYAYDRCINSSGVLRYHTTRGWVSELTRGHGRENIAEVIDVNIRTGPLPEIAGFDSIGSGVKKRTECGIPNLRSVASSMLSRLHGSQVSTIITASAGCKLYGA